MTEKDLQLQTLQYEVTQLRKENKLLKNSADLSVIKALEYIEKYSFIDDACMYTNSSKLVPFTRVEQALVDHAYDRVID